MYSYAVFQFLINLKNFIKNCTLPLTKITKQKIDELSNSDKINLNK